MKIVKKERLHGIKRTSQHFIARKVHPPNSSAKYVSQLREPQRKPYCQRGLEMANDRTPLSQAVLISRSFLINFSAWIAFEDNTRKQL